MDALMSNTTINFLLNYKRVVKYFLNESLIHSDKSLNPVDNLEDYYGLIISKIRKDNQKIYCPTNCVRVANELYELLKVEFPDLKVGLYTKDTMNRTISYSELLKEWASYNIVICTPTIVAGISFINPHFDITCGYFTSLSSIAEFSVQQIFRVRQLNKGKIYICVNQVKSNGICPTIPYTNYAKNAISYNNDYTLMREFLLKKHRDMYNEIKVLRPNALDKLREETGLKDEELDQLVQLIKSVPTKKIEGEDISNSPYLDMLVYVTLMKHYSMIRYEEVLYTLLKSQGCVKGEKFVPDENLRAEIERLSVYLKEARINKKACDSDLKEEICNQIAEAKPITRAEYNIISTIKMKTAEQSYQARRYELKNVLNVADECITLEFVKNYESYINRLKLIHAFMPLDRTTDLGWTANAILDDLTSFAKCRQRASTQQLTFDDKRFYTKLKLAGLSQDQIKNLDESIDYFYNPKLKDDQSIRHCINFLFTMGFRSPLDESTVDHKAREVLLTYYKNNQDEIRSILGYGSSKIEASSESSSESSTSKSGNKMSAEEKKEKEQTRIFKVLIERVNVLLFKIFGLKLVRVNNMATSA